jgi:hypothetical protein
MWTCPSGRTPSATDRRSAACSGRSLKFKLGPVCHAFQHIRAAAGVTPKSNIPATRMVFCLHNLLRCPRNCIASDLLTGSHVTCFRSRLVAMR